MSAESSSAENSPRLQVDEDATKEEGEIADDAADEQIAAAAVVVVVAPKDSTEKDDSGSKPAIISVAPASSPSAAVDESKTIISPKDTSTTPSKPTIPDSKLLNVRHSLTPVGSPLSLTQDVADSERKDETPTKKATVPRRRPTDFPGSPQTVVSERRQMALLRQQALSADTLSPADVNRDRPSTPSGSSTSSIRSANRRDGRGETPLHLACKKGDLAAMKKLIDDGADINAADNAGWTPLHEAANRGREEAVKLLLKNRADMRVRGIDGTTPLMDAVINGHIDVVRALLKAGADPTAVDHKGQSCAQLADNHEGIRQLLLLQLRDEPRSRTSSCGRNSDKLDANQSPEIVRPTLSLLQSVPFVVSELPPPKSASPGRQPPVGQSQYEDISDDEDDGRLAVASSVPTNAELSKVVPSPMTFAAAPLRSITTTPVAPVDVSTLPALSESHVVETSASKSGPLTANLPVVSVTTSVTSQPAATAKAEDSKTDDVPVVTKLPEVEVHPPPTHEPSTMPHEPPKLLDTIKTEDIHEEIIIAPVTLPPPMTLPIPVPVVHAPTVVATHVRPEPIKPSALFFPTPPVVIPVPSVVRSSTLSKTSASLVSKGPVFSVAIPSDASKRLDLSKQPLLMLEKKQKTGGAKSPERVSLTLKKSAPVVMVKEVMVKETSGENVPEKVSGGDTTTASAAAKSGDEQAPAGAESKPSGSGRKKKEVAPKPMTRQRAQALAVPGGKPTKRRNLKGTNEKPVRGVRAAKRALAEAEAAGTSKDEPPVVAEDAKQKRARAQLLRKIKSSTLNNNTEKEEVQIPAQTTADEEPQINLRLPLKKRLTIRNEIEEFIEQRHQVEDNWKKYTNHFSMKNFLPRNFSEFLIMKKSYNLEGSLSKRLDIPPGVPNELRAFFVVQENERHEVMREQTIERDRLIMGAEQEMVRLHQRFCRLSAGISIPYSACMIISEQESNRSFQNQDQEEKARSALKSKVTTRDLVQWLEESDRKFDGAKKEMLTRHRLEATMLRSKQRMDWAWMMDDLNMIDPSCRHPEDLDNVFIPQVIVEDFVVISDHMPANR